MCVTSGMAQLGPVKAFTHASMPTPKQGPAWIHYTGYMVSAYNMGSTPNTMLLHFPCLGTPWLVERTTGVSTLMDDITGNLPLVGPAPLTMGSRGIGSTTVQEYGDYHVVLTSSPGEITEVLGQVPIERRPVIDDAFTALIEWYKDNFLGDGFVLACFDGRVIPSHPILVGYHPDNDDVLFVPGLDGHDGHIPTLGQPMKRDIRVAFSVQGVRLPISVMHRTRLDADDYEDWAPTQVSGFWDRRLDAPNTDYVVPLENLQARMNGKELMTDLVV